MALSEIEKKEIKVFSIIIGISLVLAAIVNVMNIQLPQSGLIKALSEFVKDTIETTGYLGIFALMVLESALIPVPSEVIMPFAGYIAYLGEMDPYLIVFIGTIANLIGSLLAYYIGVHGGRPLIERYGKYIFIRKSHLDLAERLFENYGEILIFFGRMLPAIRTVISLPAGIGKMDVKKFSIYTIIGSIPWNFALVYLGYILGAQWKNIISFFEKADIIFVAALIVILVYYIKTGEIE